MKHNNSYLCALENKVVKINIPLDQKIPMPRAEEKDIEHEVIDKKKDKCNVNAKCRSYKSRNLYKMIVTSLYVAITKNKNVIRAMLTQNGFSDNDIGQALTKISSFYFEKSSKKSKMTSQSIIKKMLGNLTIYTYILRETLNAMMEKWKAGVFGKTLPRNVEIYKFDCESFYMQAVKVCKGIKQTTLIL